MESRDNIELVKPIVKNGPIYDNPWPTWHKPSTSDILRLIFCRKNNTNLPSDKSVRNLIIIII